MSSVPSYMARLARLTTVVLLAASVVVPARAAVPEAATGHGAPPPSPASDHVDTLHGVQVADPYRWLEQDGPETSTWLDAQDKYAQTWLQDPAAKDQRERIRAVLTRVWNYPKRSAPFERGGRYFWRENSGLQNQAPLYWSDKPTGPGKLLVDPNLLAKDGTVSLQSVSISRDGKLLAYAVSTAGSDWQEIRLRDVTSGNDLADVVQWVKFSSPEWNADGTGFWYGRYDQPQAGKSLTDINKFQKLHFHRVGQAQATDEVVVQAPAEPDWSFGASLSDDGRYLTVSVGRGAVPKNQVWVRDLQQPDGPFVRLISDFSAQYQVLGNTGSKFYLKTDAGAERSHIVSVDMADPAAKPQVVVAESPATLVSALMVADGLVLHYLKDASSQLAVHDLSGTKRADVRLPIATVQGLSGHQGSAQVFVQLSSFLIPGQILALNPTNGKTTTLFEARVPADLKRYDVQQTWATSKDGTKVPAFVVRTKKAKPGQFQPTYLYAYGGFNANLTPSFSPAVLAWLELGGTYAVANLRGGGEFGRAWHEAGMREKKQNVFDDFYAVAAHLVAQKWTQPSLLGVGGGSNGGLLIGAALAQRPDLFGAALPAVGVMDMLRFHQFTIGWAWVPEYGSADDPAAFAWLRAYSPVHNLAQRCYPATMVLTGDHDDRVVPAHSFKFTAALQAAQKGPAPVLLRLDRKAGHGAGKPTSKQIDEYVDRWDFLLRSLKPGPTKGTISCQSTP